MPHLEYLVGLALIVLGVTYGKAIFRVLSLRLRTELGPERIAASDVPDDIRALLEAESRPLAELGFEPVAFVRTPCVLDGVDQPTWARLLQHPAEKSFAWLAIAGASRTRPCEVTFHAQADEGRRLETLGYPIADEHPDCPKHVVIDARTASLAEQWGRHQCEVAARPDFAPRDVSADELLVEQRAASACAMRTAIARGRFAPAGEGVARYTLNHAVATVVSSTRRDASKRAAIAKHDKARLAAGAVPPAADLGAAPADVTAEVWAHRRREGAERSRRAGWITKLALFGLSTCAAAIAFGLKLSVEMLGILFGVLLVHELGHALAMKAFGYRNLQILFIPFFGAVASGSKRSVPPWQEIVVLLAGPVPGIVGGTALLCATTRESSPQLYNLAWSMLIVNYANLLPIMPLDGGRILNVALFDRFPNLQLGFAGLSGLALLGLGSALDEMVLRAIGLVMLLGLPAQWKHTRLLAGARKRLSETAPSPEAADPVPALYTELRQPKFDSLNSESKYQLVTQLAERLLRRPAGAGLALASVVGWLAIMVLPLGFVSYAPAPDGGQVLAKAKAQQEHRVATWTAKIAAATSPKEEVEMRLAAARDLAAHFDAAGAKRELEPSLALFAKLDEPALESSALLLLAGFELTPPDEFPPTREAVARAERRLGRALDLREQRFGMESPEVAEVLQAFPVTATSDRVAALVRTLRLISIYERAPDAPGASGNLVHAYQLEARLRDERGDAERAERALQQALAAADASRGADREDLQLEALEELGGFYLARERHDDARALLARRPDAQASAADRCWIDYWQGDGEASSRCFAALRGELAKHPGAGDEADWLGLELLVDEAAAKARAGDAAAARALMDQARDRFRARSGGKDLAGYLHALAEAWPTESFAGRETNRRKAERERVLEPLLDGVADAG